MICYKRDNFYIQTIGRFGRVEWIILILYIERDISYADYIQKMLIEPFIVFEDRFERQEDIC